MPCTEVTCVCSKIGTKTHKFKVWAERRICLMLDLVVGKLTTQIYTVKIFMCTFLKQYMQCTYNVTMRRVHETIVHAHTSI